MKTGQMVRVKPASPIAKEWGIEQDARGEVLCTYQSNAGPQNYSDKVDVRFGADTTIWGAPAGEFEPLGDAVKPQADTAGAQP